MGAIVSLVLGGVWGFIKRVMAWFAANPAAGLTLLMAAAFVMVVLSKNGQINELRKTNTTGLERITTLRASLAQGRANEASMATSLHEQNDSINQLAVQGTASAARFDQLMSAMTTQNTEDKKELAALDAAKPTADKCGSALALIKGAVK